MWEVRNDTAMNHTAMNKMIAAAALALLAISAAPAYAQTNTEMIRDIDNNVEQLLLDFSSIVREIRVVLDDVRDLLYDINEIQPALDRNHETLMNLEAAILGEKCGEGTSPVNGECVADITMCDAEVVNGICKAAITCGEGTLLHVDTCIADISISYCGEGTVFSGGVCVASGASAPAGTAGTAGTTGTTGTAPGTVTPDPVVEPTIVQPVEANRYVVDGDTVRVEDTEYDLAFATAPGLSEAGGRDAVLYLERLCADQTTPIRVTPQDSPAVMPKAVVECDGIDASWALVSAGYAAFNSDDCEIREFLNVKWTHDRCIEAAAPAPAPAATTPTTPTAPTTPTTPAAPAAGPIYGERELKTYTFPVTVGDIVKWDTDANNDPMTTTSISCTFPHTPMNMDVHIQDNSAGVYTIDTAPDYTDGNRHGTYVELNSPMSRTLFEQKFAVGGGEFVAYDREISLISVGAFDGDYSVSMLVSDWDDATWTDTNTPPVPTAAELQQTVLTIELQMLSNIDNMECHLGSAGAPSGATNPQPQKLLGMAATAPDGAALLDIVPYDVTCSETITITGVSAQTTTDFISTFSVIHLEDVESGDSIAMALGDPAQTGLSFQTSAFTVGDGDKVAPADRDDVSLDGVALVTVDYSSATDEPCVWTERTS